MMKQKIFSKLNQVLKTLVRRMKLCVGIVCVCELILVLFYVFYYHHPMKVMLSNCLTILWTSVFIWFSFQFVVWVQIKNPRCSENALTLFSILAILAFGLGSILFCIEFFCGSFTISAFWGPIATLSFIRIQAKRKF